MSPTRRPSGPELRRALKASDLPAPARAILLCLLVYHYDWTHREIPAELRPSLTDLQVEAGYCRTTIRDHLHALELAGWITRTPPPIELARREHHRTAYELHIPGSEHEAACRAAQPAGQDAKARREAIARYVRERQAANAERRSIPTATVGRGRRARRSAQRLDAGDWTADRELVGLASAELAAAAGHPVDDAIARDTVRLVLGGRSPGKPAEYLVAAIRREPARFLPTAQPPPAAGLAPIGDGRASDEHVDKVLRQAGLRRPAASTKGST